MCCSVIRKGTAIFWNIFQPFFTPITVFFRSMTRETKVIVTETMIKMSALLETSN